MTRIHFLAGGTFWLSGILHAAQLANGDFKVDLTPDFPGLRSYSYLGDSVTIPANSNPVVRINGQDFKPEVRLIERGPAAADYELRFNDVGVSMTARVLVNRNGLTISLADIHETGSLVVRTIEIPGLTLIHGGAAAEVAVANFPAASYASEKPEDHDTFGTLSGLTFENHNRNRDESGRYGASYVFVSNGQIAAGIHTNVMEENLRIIFAKTGEKDGSTFSAAPGKWTYREIPSEICPAPVATLVVAADQNGDGKVTWQDAAIEYRRAVPLPYGGEDTKKYTMAHIAMNFGSQATNPFLRVLDNAKKVWLYTDGLGQTIQFKGFAGEGHDSSHPDYAGNVGRRMGGRDDLNFVMRRGKDFNVRSGVHINAHEYHKEAKWFNPDIADLNAIGWSWLDESYLADYRHDSAYGTLYQRLDAMRADLPWLDFVYLDVYYGRGWPGWRMHQRTNDLGIRQFTEFPGVMERAVVWNHVANDWTQQIGGKGDRSAIARFIWYSLKDTFQHDPLLRGTNCDGFMGWHAETNMRQTIRSAINVNLPTKYLQHFELMRLEDQGAWFSGGPRTESDGTVSKVFGRDGQLVHSCRYEKPKSRPVDNLAFIPWDPMDETKIYHWNDKGGTSVWQVPVSWKNVTTAQLYRLTDLGRVFVSEIPVRDGRVTLDQIEPSTPYVLYRETPPALPEMNWGEGGLLRDPGFDSHRFGDWRLVTADATAQYTNHPQTGQTELVIPSGRAAEVRQTVHGLKPGQTYAASVWLSIEKRRECSLAIEAGPQQAAPFIDRQTWKVVSAPKHLGGDRPRRMFDGDPKTLWHSAEINEANANPLPHEITIDLGRESRVSGFIQTARERLHNGAIKGYKAHVSADGSNWKEMAAGEFDYSAGNAVAVRFKAPVKARYFRLTALSEVQNRPFTSIAELDIITDDKGQAPNGLATPVSRSVNQTFLTNFTDQSSKYTRNWHRMKVLFTAPEDGRVDLVLRAAEGEGTVAFDDARLVASGISMAPAGSGNVVIFEDFENVDEGWGPFVYGWKGPMNTHLSEANPPYTNDTIQGEFSLKSRREDSPGMLYRTVPASLSLKAGKSYTVSFDYLCDTPECFAFVAGSDKADGHDITAKAGLSGGEWKVHRFTTTFTAGEDAFIGISKLSKEKPGTIVIDNVLVTE
jgi:hypothetical protein